MSELAAPLSRSARALRRLQRLEDTLATIARLQSQVRLELAALSREDTPPAHRRFLPDELAIAFAESPGSAERMVTTALVYSEHPAVVARVGQPLAQGGWSIRHADAVLDELLGMGLSHTDQQHVIDLVVSCPDARTPHQVRKATRAAIMICDPAAAERRLAKTRKDRHVYTLDGAHGQALFGAAGTTTQIAMVMASIDALAGPKQPGDDRTLDQRRFDAFMDLICGRTVPAQWQALVVVPLSVLEGSDDPAEVPGHGLISAGEARDVLAHAELRRAVVDTHGQLVSVDTTTHRPNLPTPTPLTTPDPDLHLSHQTEPAPLDTTPEHPTPETDAHWLLHQLHAAEGEIDDTSTDLTVDLTDDAAVEVTAQAETAIDAAVQLLRSELETQLTALLETALLGRGARTTFRPSGPSPTSPAAYRPAALTETSPWTHDPDGDPDGPGPDSPPSPAPGSPTGRAPQPDPDPGAPEPEPEPPSRDDLTWHDTHQDRAAQDAHEPPPRYQHEPPGRPRPAPPTSSWTRTALTTAHTRLRTTPADRTPLTSRAYALPPRLARHVKHRDITCTFPGCPRLARTCQNDHLVPWPRGTTTATNISSECTHHHQAKHTCFTTTRTPDGSIRWTTPLGRTALRLPRPLLRGW